MIARAVEDWRSRRIEWKCNAQNLPSRRAAERLGFSFEGIFRQHMIVKGQNRDSAWFSICDLDWPDIKACHLKWLDAPEGSISLTDLTAPLLRPTVRPVDL